MRVWVAIAALLLFCACKGPKGDTGDVGAQGATGPQGVQGPTGEAGANGSDGTVITLVQFCPGTTSYPSTFPEVGLCINSQIYAVYSANDGFLTLIPPGTYNSNAVGSSCTFKVKPNCVVQQ